MTARSTSCIALGATKQAAEHFLTALAIQRGSMAPAATSGSVRQPRLTRAIRNVHSAHTHDSRASLRACGG